MPSTKFLAAVTSLIATSAVLVCGTPPATSAVAGDASEARSGAAPIVWGPCREQILTRFGGECALVTVPLDHADPAGPTIQLAVSRVLHTKTPYRGVVFTNPGGPGGSGTYLAVAGQFVPHGVGLTYDWYGVDPRGVGASVPALTCDDHYFEWNRPSYEPSSPKLMRYWRRTTEEYAADCGAAPAAQLLGHVRSTDTVADFETLREAIGAEQITFYGVSYGTYLAQVYATLHPDRIKAMVLDSVLDPDRVFYQVSQDQNRGVERTLGRFFAWIGDHADVFHLGHSKAAVNRAYQRLHGELARHPAEGRVGPNELEGALEPAAYVNDAWVDVAGALSDLVNHGRAAGIRQIYRGGYPVGKGADNYHAMGLAIACTDALWPQKWSTWRQDSRRMAKKAPFYTWQNTWYAAPCRTWPAAARARVEVTGEGYTAPVLMLNETLDGATPFKGALAARALFPSAALVAGVGGTSHAAGLSGIPCTDSAIADLLEDGSLPHRKRGNRADKECPPVPIPEPS
jgi:pimeloyl-ACP methyl ester carboxylesterase